MQLYISPRIINALRTHTARNDVRENLNGIRMYSNGHGRVLLEATDGHRLIRHWVEADVLNPFEVVFIPPKLAQRAESVRIDVDTKAEQPTVEIYEGNKKHSPAIVGLRFPDTDGVVPGVADCTGEQAAFNPQLLSNALDALGQIGKGLGINGSVPSRVHYNGTAGIRIDSNRLPDTVAVVMPMKD